ncbi:MAG: 1-deoxy-D-xylulose-5-phosphate synthase [Oscillospiraceae bacterium]|nr:1-deoxy-D-xylulose-5-phosphate synthase [Oscillospiraceae bacterium]
MYKFLNKDISPDRLKTLSGTQLKLLCREIRQFLIKTVSRTGGHLASNLGTVELTVALHKVFDSPRDKIVFDVGHQCYAHKLLTGRFEQFATLRSEGGVSGFPRQAESPHDAFIAGHSGVSVSAALGIAEALRQSGAPHKTIAVAGDGSFTDGAIYEGLNNAGKSGANLLVILNDNGMSISKNTGAFAAYLSSLRANRKYHATKQNVKAFLGQSAVGEAVSDAVSATKKVVKNTVYYRNTHGNLFENLGFKYYGIVDGHNLEELVNVLELTKLIDTPCLIHVNTKKGKGFKPAERNSGEYHGVSVGLCERLSEKSAESSKNRQTVAYSQVFGQTIADFAEHDESIVLISAAMKYATGCNYFNDRFPERFYDCGIAEGHAVTFAAGLASVRDSKSPPVTPVFAVYSTFLQRGFDRLLHDAAIEKQHIVLAIDRAGVVGEDGETHQGVFDVAMLSVIPGVTLFSPANVGELKECLRKALYEINAPVAVRYPRGAARAGEYTGEWRLFAKQSGRLVVTYGRLTEKALARDCDVIQLVRIVPLPEEAVAAAAEYRDIVFWEEGSERGGIGEALLLALTRRGWRGKYDIKAVTDFIPCADAQTQLRRIIT